MKSTESEAFVMSARLVEISELVADLPLSRVMLANDARFPWLMLIPRRANMQELFDLSAAEQGMLMREITAVSRMLKELTAYSRDGDQSFQDGDHGFQVMVITGSRDRDHSRRHAPTDVLMLCGKWCFGQGPFFGSTRAASILPSRPQFSQPHARRGLSRLAASSRPPF